MIDLPPGIELDERIEKMLGGRPEATRVVSHLPKRYSTHIAAAWDIVDFISDFRVEHNVLERRGKWRAYGMDRSAKVVLFEAYSNHSAPHAICLAALNAFET